MKSFHDWRYQTDILVCENLIIEDEEFSMARGELTTIKNSVSRLMKKLKGEGNLEAWVQSKITKAADYISTVADHMEGGEDDTERNIKEEHDCGEGKYWCRKDKKCKKIPRGYHMMKNGYLMRDSDHEEDNDENGGNGDGGGMSEGWSKKYKDSIDCNNPKGFSQKAHCQGKKKGISEACWKGYVQKGLKKKGKRMVPNCVKEDSIEEANKSGDSSLRDWFTKSRSSDGTPGWVQLGGKYAGKPCARQPGQTTKPKCGSSKMKADLSDKEEEKAFRRKNRQDPNPDRKGKAKNVATEAIDASKYGGPDKLLRKMLPKGEVVIPSKPLKSANIKDKEVKEEKDACYKKVKSRYSVWPSAYASGALVKCRKVGAKNWGNKSKKDVKEGYTRIQERGATYSIMLNWRGRIINTQMFFAKFTRPTKNEVVQEIRKVYPNATVLYFSPSIKDPTKPLLFAGESNGIGKN